jgi:hypothetical protein
MSRSWTLVLLALTSISGCALQHVAPVEARPLPPPAGAHVVHSGRLVIAIAKETKESQCVKNERYRPLCFQQVRTAIGRSLTSNFWPSFHEIEIASADEVQPGDYLLEVSLALEPIPPDESGPGWSVGAKSQYRLSRDGQALAQETLASRSRADLPYGEPLAGAAADTLAATMYHISARVSEVPESRPETPPELPKVASHSLDPGLSNN